MKRESSNSKYPKNIARESLPKNVYFDSRGRGRWIYRKSRSRKDRGKEIRLGDASLTLGKIWQKVEDLLNDREDNFKYISNLFLKSDEYKELAKSTKTDYDNCHNAICKKKMKSGDIFCEAPLSAWTPGAVRKYRDVRKLESKTRAAHEIRYMKRVFNWAIQYDLTSENPAKPVDLKGLNVVREHYVEDEDYIMALILAPWQLALAFHMIYLTGRRPKDVLEMSVKNVQPEGLLMRASKTVKYELVQSGKDLDACIKMLTEDGQYDFFNWSESGFNTAVNRLMRELESKGYNRFRPKDLQKKYAVDIEDTGINASEQFMHSDAALTRRHYLPKATKVNSLDKCKMKQKNKPGI